MVLLGGGAGELALTLRARLRCDLRKHVGLAEDQDIVAAELDLGAAVLGEDDLVSRGDVQFDVFAMLVPCAGPDGQDTAALRLLPGRVGQHDPAPGCLFLLEHLDDQSVSEWLQVHRGSRTGPRTGPRWFVDTDSRVLFGDLIRSALPNRSIRSLRYCIVSSCLKLETIGPLRCRGLWCRYNHHYTYEFDTVYSISRC